MRRTAGLRWTWFGPNNSGFAVLPHLLLVIVASLNIQSCRSSSRGRTTPSPPPPRPVIDPCDNSTAWRNATSVYDFAVKTINGETVPLEKYRGKVLLIVNIATKEGFTDLTALSYKQLVQLHALYFKKGLRILAFPCNQFSNMTPHNNADIKTIAKSYFVKFDLFEKIEVNGRNASPLWKYLTEQLPGMFGINHKYIKWNFTKFIISRYGIPVRRCAPANIPVRFAPHLERYLKQKITDDD